MSINRIRNFQNHSSRDREEKIACSDGYKTSHSFDKKNNNSFNNYENVVVKKEIKRESLNWSDLKDEEEQQEEKYEQHQNNFSKSYTSRKRLHSKGDENSYGRYSHQSPGRKPAKISRTSRSQPQERDPEVLARRDKQISYGKNTVAYTDYLEAVPKGERTQFHPRTPNKNLKLSRRNWDARIKVWRKALHDIEGFKKSEEERFVKAMDEKKYKNLKLNPNEEKQLDRILARDSNLSVSEMLVKEEHDIVVKTEIKEEKEDLVKLEIKQENDPRRRRDCNSDSESDDDLIFLDDEEDFL